MAALRALGAHVDDERELSASLRERRLEISRRATDAVSVAWDGRPAPLRLRLPPVVGEGRASFRLELEDGDVRRWSADLVEAPASTETIEGETRVVRRVRIPSPLPLGVHRLSVRVGDVRAEVHIVAAPSRAASGGADRSWGMFLPLHALRWRGDWGIGDLSGLGHLSAWVGSEGGSVVGSTPILAAFLDEPFEPGPYMPVSRRFWNELYVDPAALPDVADCAEARDLLRSPGFRSRVRALRRAPLVDYRGAMAAKREVLEVLARHAFERPARRREVEVLVGRRPDVADYARFRAAVERRGASWPEWPTARRRGRLSERDVDPDAVRYHLYAQWAAERQLRQLNGSGAASLYLDFPLGVHPGGYDTWSEGDAFVPDVSIGAPPDDFSPGGQGWGFPPPHPEGMRKGGYRYLRACLGHLLEAAGALRVDHVMGLHRLYWIPPGLAPTEGVYVRYRAEEQYAVFLLEAARHGAVVVGEDLGTVPAEVRAAMDRRGVRRSFVVQAELRARGPAVPPPTPGSAASLNTHDMPTFLGFREGRDIQDRLARGVIDDREAAALRRERERLIRALDRFLRDRGFTRRRGELGAAEALTASLRHLAATDAGLVLVSAEDLWLEPEPQNVPGTTDERPNWRRRARYPLERMHTLPEVVGTVRDVDRIRRGRRS